MLVMSLLNYGLRFMRWQQYLGALAHPMPWRPSARIYLAGFALTTTPGKAGEALRGVLLKRWHVPYTHSLAAFLSERLSDLAAIVLLAFFGLSLYPKIGGVVAVGAAGVLAGLAVLSQRAPARGLAAWGANGISRLRGFATHFSRMLDVARVCHAPKLLATSTLLSVVAWIAEALAFHWMLSWLGVDIQITFSVFIYSVAMLAGALSFCLEGWAAQKQ